jgi:hypothetical protein
MLQFAVEVVQEQVGQQWGERATLWRALPRGLHHSLQGEDSGFQEPMDQRHHAPVRHPRPHPAEQDIVVDPVEKLFQVKIYHPRIPLPDVGLGLRHRLVGTALRAKAVAPFRERRVPVCLQHLQQGLLDEPVEDDRYPQVSGPTPRLRDRHPAYRLGSIGSFHQRGPNRRPVGLEVRPQLLHAHPVDPRRTLVAADLAQRAPEILRVQYAREEVLPFHRSVCSPCPSPGFIPVDRVAQGQRELPVGCRTATRHEATAPLLQSPFGAPFGPSVQGVRLGLSVAPPFGLGVPH